MQLKTTHERKKILQELNQYAEEPKNPEDIERFIKAEPTRKDTTMKYAETNLTTGMNSIQQNTPDQLSTKQPVRSSSTSFKYLTYILVGLVLLVIIYSVLFLIFRIDRRSEDIARLNILPIGMVDGEMIWFGEFNQDRQALMSFYKKNYDSGYISQIPPLAEIEKAVWQRLSKEIIIRYFAQRNDLSVSSAEVENEMAIIVQEFTNSDTLQQFIKENYNWTPDQFKQKIIVPYLLRNKVTAWFEQNESVKTTAAKSAEQIWQDITDNKIAFAQANDQYSDDAVAKTNGGSLGEFSWGTMVPEFEQTLKLLKIGEISKPIQTQFGWHIIRRDDLSTSTTDKTKVAASHILISYFNFDKWLNSEIQKNKITLWLRMP